MLRRISRLVLVAVLVAAVVEALRRRSLSQPDAVPAATPWKPLEPTPRERPETTPEPTPAAPATDDPTRSWIGPEGDGTCPASHPLKAKEASKIVHQPGGLSYDRTKADRCYVDLDAARADGYRAAKR